MNKSRLICLIADKGMTQKELADKAGVSKATINMLINHNSNPRLDTLGRIAKVLGVRPSELLDMHNVGTDELPMEEITDKCAKTYEAYEDAKKKRARIMRVVNSDLQDFVQKLADNDKEFQEIHNILYTALSEYTSECIRIAGDAHNKAADRERRREHDSRQEN